MAAPRDADLPVLVYHRQSITYVGVPAVVAGMAIAFDRTPAISTGTPVFGILESDAVTGQDATIAVAGICQALAGGAITPGTPLSVDGIGRAIAAAVGNQIFGRALSAATAAGQKVQVLITREGTA